MEAGERCSPEQCATVALNRADLEKLLQALELQVVNKERIRDMLEEGNHWDNVSAQLVALKRLQQRLRAFALLTVECDALALHCSTHDTPD